MARGTAQEREQWADERRQYEKTMIIGGDCNGMLVLKHIDGSLFKASLTGDSVYISQRIKEPIKNGFVFDTNGAFRLWSDE